MTARIGPGMVVRWRKDSGRRIANGYTTASRHRVLAIRVVQLGETNEPTVNRGDLIVIMTHVDSVTWADKDQRRVYRVHERDVERVP